VLKKCEILHWAQHNLLQIIEIAVNFTSQNTEYPLIYTIHYSTVCSLLTIPL